MKQIEQTFNFALGEVLPLVNPTWIQRNGTLSVFVEMTGLISGTNKRPDILVNDSTTPPVIIESSYKPKDADEDAHSRLGLKLASTGYQIESSVAVFIPECFRNYEIEKARDALLGEEPIYYALHQRVGRKPDYEFRRWVDDGFIEGTASDLAQLVSSASIPKESAARIAEQIANSLEQAANILEELLTTEQQRTIAREVHQATNLKGLRTTSVLWLNAFIVQQRLANLCTPESDNLSFGDSSPMPSRILNEWNKILCRNWSSIFYPAVESMKTVSSMQPRAASKAISHILKGVERIFTHGWEILFNVGAELFPRLSDDRKQAAAFYTQPSTAELLASLTIQKNDFASEKWADSNFPVEHKIADFACGTGTLLRAGYQRIRRFHEECSESLDSPPVLHRNAMEYGLIGIDVSPIAAHLASSTLAIQGYGDGYARTSIGWCEVGGERHATGSLELFEEQNMNDLFGNIGHSVHGRNVPSNFASISVNDDEIQYVLMNPPYSRTRGGQSAFDLSGLSGQDRKDCQKKWGKLIKNQPANRKAGMAASFLALARKKLKVGGRMGFVLPLTAAFAESWRETRQMIENEFESIIAIAVSGGKALGDHALSADTGMEEMLLICQRKQDDAAHFRLPPCTTEALSIYCVTLREPPLRLGEAGEIGKVILNSFNLLSISPHAHTQPIRLGKSELGHLFKFQHQCCGDPWSALGVTSADLAVASLSLRAGRLVFGGQNISLGISMCTLSELFEVGPTHDLIGSGPDSTAPRGVFTIYPVQGSADAIGIDRCIWHADAKKQNKLLSAATHKGIPKPEVEIEKLHSIRESTSTLFYCKNLRWTSQKLISTISTFPVLGGRTWVSLKQRDVRIQHAFCLWSNSTMGMLLHWSVGQRTQNGRSSTQVDAVKKILCPNFENLPNKKLDQASSLLQSLQTKPMLPACQAFIDSVRRAIDDAVVELLGLSEESKNVIDQLRYLWCHEPSIHGNNKEALALLKKSHNSH